MRVCKSIVFILFFIFANYNAGLELVRAQPSMGEIDKMQRDIEMERALRTEVEKAKKVFIKKIIIKGATLIAKGQIKEIIQPFKNHWLTETDINLILDSITSAYKQKGYQNQPAKISFQVKKGNLEITVAEIKH